LDITSIGTFYEKLLKVIWLFRWFMHAAILSVTPRRVPPLTVVVFSQLNGCLRAVTDHLARTVSDNVRPMGVATIQDVDKLCTIGRRST
jgi:hypothetical protein